MLTVTLVSTKRPFSSLVS